MEQILEKNKLNKGFKIAFGINCIMLLIMVLLYWYGCAYEAQNTGLLEIVEIFSFGFVIVFQMFISFLISLILLIITTILGIVNYRKNQKREIRKKIIIMLSSIIIFHIVIVLGFIILPGNTNTYNNNIEEGTNADSTVTLTERQKNILTEEGLPTDYNELTHTQRSAIVAIEEMLCAMETKYRISFEYAGYIPGGILDKEQLTAYPSSGDSEDDIFTVTRTFENGEYVYEDGYKNLVTKSVFNEFILNYCNEQLGKGNVKVYSLVNNIKTDEFPLSLKNVAHNVDGDNFIFIDGAVISKEKYDIFVTELKSWLTNNEVRGSNRVILLNRDELKYLTRYNYTDYRLDRDWICAEFVNVY